VEAAGCTLLPPVPENFLNVKTKYCDGSTSGLLEEKTMGWLAWILVGLVAGVIAKMVMPGVRDEPSGMIGTILLGIVGAVVGGWVWTLALGSGGVNGFNLGSLFVAFVGSCIVIGIMRLFDRSTRAY